MATWAIRTGLAGLVFLSSMSAKADSGGCVSVISAGVPIFGVSSVVSESGPVPSANPAKPPQPAIPPDSVQPSAEREVIAEARLEHKYVQDVIHNRCSEAARDLRQVEHPTHRFVEELTAELGARSPMTVAGTRMILNNLRFPLADHPYLSNAVVWLAGSQDPRNPTEGSAAFRRKSSLPGSPGFQ